MSIGCRCCSCPATCSPPAGRTRCCSSSRISPTPPSRPTTASARCRATSIASRARNSCSPRLRRAMPVLTDPAECGPVTLALCQDVQAEAFDWPGDASSRARVWSRGARRRTRAELAKPRRSSARGTAPLIVAGGGVLVFRGRRRTGAVRAAPRHAGGRDAGRQRRAAARPPAEPRRRSASPARGGEPRGRGRRCGAGGRHAAAGLHHRLARRCSAAGQRIVALNVQPFDAAKHAALPLVADAREGLEALERSAGPWHAAADMDRRAQARRALAWRRPRRSPRAATPPCRPTRR